MLLDRLVDQIEQECSADRGVDVVWRLIRDCPWLLACLPREKRYWDPADPRKMPDRTDGEDFVEDLGRALGPGRPRGATPPDLAMDLLRILPHGRAFPRGFTDEERRLLGLPEPRFALETACAYKQEDPTAEVQDVRDWVARTATARDQAARIEEASWRVRRRLENWVQRVRHGRRETGQDADQVRLIAPQIVPDFSVFPRQVDIPPAGGVERTDRLLLDWLRSDRLERLLVIVTGHRLDRLRFFPDGATWRAFRSARAAPFWRVVERFEPGDLGYRGAVAMVSGAQPGGPIDLVLPGFAASASDLRRKWLGEATARQRDVRGLVSFGPPGTSGPLTPPHPRPPSS
jgi:hypothetical protein